MSDLGMGRREFFLYRYYGCPPPPRQKRDEICETKGCEEASWIKGHCPDHLRCDLAAIWSHVKKNPKAEKQFLKLLGH